MKILFGIMSLLEKTVLIGFLTLVFYCFVMIDWKKQQINKEINIQKLDDELRDKILHPHLYKDCGI